MARQGKRKSAGNRKVEPLGKGDRKAVFLLAAATCALLVGAAGFWTVLTSQHHAAVGGPYALTDGHGRPVTQSDFSGRYTLLYFGYTHCVDVCPLTLATVSTALDELGHRGDAVTPVFVSVDPARDTPQRVQEYVTGFSSRIIGLTGTPAQVRPVLDAFHVSARHRAGTEPDYLVDHSSLLYLMDGQNQLVGMIPVDSSAHQIATDLGRMLPRS